jgi:hypothetical protein
MPTSVLFTNECMGNTFKSRNATKMEGRVESVAEKGNSVCFVQEIMRFAIKVRALHNHITVNYSFCRKQKQFIETIDL